MTEEKAIERLKDLIHTCDAGIKEHGEYDDFFKEDKEAIKTVLNMLKEKDKEIEKLKKHNKELLRKLRNRVKEVKKLNKYSLYKKEFKTLNEQLKKKDKIIEKLEKEAQKYFEEIIKQDRAIDLMAECIDVELSSARLGIILNKNVQPLENYKEYIKQYFKSKAEKE